jgi:hypothetical protein
MVGADARARDDARTWNGCSSNEPFREGEMRRPRLSIRQWMIAIAVMATLFGIYMHLVRESLRPDIGFVGSNGSHWSRSMTDKEIADFDWTLHESAIKGRDESALKPAAPHQ